jgi:membrane protein DedA with SNARE-associated domain
MFHELIKIWFEWVQHWGYFGVFILMALESTIVPVPSEVVMPPAAYWASQGHMSFSGVVIAGTLGSYFGSALSYFFFRWASTPFIEKYGKYARIKAHKIKKAEDWINAYGPFGVFMARLLPVVRHLISIPAGILKMHFVPFSLATITGAGIWCWILAWFGQKTLGANPNLLNSPEEMVKTMKGSFVWFVVFVFLFLLLYIFVVRFKVKTEAKVEANPNP